MRADMWVLAVVGLASVSAARASGPEPDALRECPLHAAHREHASGASAAHDAAVDERHDQATGVSHTESAHQFKLGPRGGSIQLEVTDAGNVAGRDRIRTHLARIAADFAQGTFTTPMTIHGQTPPGVDVMQRLKTRIRYRFVRTPRGGRVDITADEAEATSAVHDFLRFQVEEHRTGDGG